MTHRLLVIIGAFLTVSPLLAVQLHPTFDVRSPDNAVTVHITAGPRLLWSVSHKGTEIIAPSPISMSLDNGDVLGNFATIRSKVTESIDRTIAPINYTKALISDRYHQLTLKCANDYGIIIRVYNDAAAYRFFTTRSGEIVVKNEQASFNFSGDRKGLIPYQEDYRAKQLFNSAFESLYNDITLSQFAPESLAFLPLLVDAGAKKKIVILEADLEDYPGMYLRWDEHEQGLTAVYAPYPLETEVGGYASMNAIPTKRAEYIARTAGTREFPWRAVVISETDKDLLNNDIVQKLASPPRITDLSWIRPGQVAWDWWNDWNITHVDFRAGINTATYKYYIDFAAANHIPYIIMDEGWSEKRDLMRTTPAIDLPEILRYGKERGVGVILWALWINVTSQMDTAFPLYAKMGAKGFKIDFIDRDDQLAIASTYAIAKKAAEYHLLVDYHGVSKPAGLQRTYPNVIGYEGVKGLEHYKWSNDQKPEYEVTVPYIRMMAGPMDYTPGAMRNATKETFRPVFSSPMSQGTRTHQLAMYVVYAAPLQMLSDNPTSYRKEQECTDFITSVPTTFDETVALDGSVGEFVSIARRKGDTWYAGVMSNWTARDIAVDCSFLGNGTYEAVVFKDGINADRDATDYVREVIRITAKDTVKIHLAPGGGCAMRISNVQ